MTTSTPAGADQSTLTVRIRSALFEIAAGDPEHSTRGVLWIVTTLVALLLIWAVFAKLDVVAVAEGKLVPKTYVKIVQPAESGIVREILVREGDAVTQGQVLVRLDPTLNAADSTATTRELSMQRLRLRRIEAELEGKVLQKQDGDDPVLFAHTEAQARSHRQASLDATSQAMSSLQRARKELDAAREVQKKLEESLPSYERSADAFDKLARDKLVGTLQAEEKRREALEKAKDLQSQTATVAALVATVEQERQRLAELRSNYTNGLNEDRLMTMTELTKLEQLLSKLGYQQGLLELRAPQAGTVKELATTTLGAVVQPGTVLLSLVPANEPLLAEVLVENKDIGFVKPGQEVRLKLAAYQFQKYGLLEGTVRTVSADASDGKAAGEKQSSVASLGFKALVELRTQGLRASDFELPLAAGMQLSAEIVQEQRTVLEYLLSPVQRVVSESGRER